MESKYEEIESIYTDQKPNKIGENEKKVLNNLKNKKKEAFEELKKKVRNETNTTYLENGKIELHRLPSSRKSSKSKTAERSFSPNEQETHIFSGSVKQLKADKNHKMEISIATPAEIYENQCSLTPIANKPRFSIDP